MEDSTSAWLLAMPTTSSIRPSYVNCVSSTVAKSTSRSMMMRLSIVELGLSVKGVELAPHSASPAAASDRMRRRRSASRRAWSPLPVMRGKSPCRRWMDMSPCAARKMGVGSFRCSGQPRAGWERSMQPYQVQVGKRLVEL